MTLLGAQVLYFSQPFFMGLDRQNHLHALANLLEDRSETQAFICYLREATQW